ACPGVRALPVEGARRNHHRVAHVGMHTVGWPRQLGHAVAGYVRLLGMPDWQLLARRGLDRFTDAYDLATLVWREPQAETLGVGNDVEHAAIRDVHLQRAERWHLERCVQVDDEGGHVAKPDRPDLALGALGGHPDQACRRLEHQLGN